MVIQEKIKFAIIDDHEMVRDGFINLIETNPSWAVMAACSTHQEAVEQLSKKRIHVALVDINLPDKSGLSLASHIKSNFNIKVIMVSMYDHFHYVNEAIKLNVDGYLSKQAASSELLKAIKTVLSNQKYFPQEFKKILPCGNSEMNTGLSEREKQVLELLALGLSPKKIAFELHVDAKTIFTHRANIYKKLGISSSFEALKYAIQIGLVPLNKVTK